VAGRDTTSILMIKLSFIAVGLILLVLAAAIGISVRRFTQVATSADGVVARLNAGGSHPQIDFVTATGQKVSYPQGGLIFGARVGDHVHVLYRPDNPLSSARVDRFGTLYFVPMLLAALGVVLLICSANAGPSNSGTKITVGRR